MGHAAIAALDLQPGEHVLDIGCGIGGTPATLARRVGSTGEVVALDLLQAAIDVAVNDADLPANIIFVAGDAQRHPFAPASFDAIFSRFGIMFFDDPVAAFRNLAGAVRVGGRLAFVCWRGLEENELDHLPLRAAAPYLPPKIVHDTGRAGWFSFSDPQAIRSVLGERAGPISGLPHTTLLSAAAIWARRWKFAPE